MEVSRSGVRAAAPVSSRRRAACGADACAIAALLVLAAGTSSVLGCGGQPESTPAPTASLSANPAPSPPQGRIIQIIEGFALDERHRVWRSTRDGTYVQDDFQSRPARLVGWPCWMLNDGRIECAPHEYPGMNPTARPTWSPSEWGPDESSPLAFAVRHDMQQWGRGEYVEARGADQLMRGCFRRGSKVYRSGRDFGCPQPNPRVVRTSVAPELPVELPGRPDQVGTCWDPVEQPLEAERLFPGCLALDTGGVLHRLHVLRPPLELAVDVRFATTLEDHRILIIHQDGTATIRPGDVGHERAPSPASLPAGPPTPVDLSPVRALHREGVIFEDGTAAMFWSEEQLLRPLAGFTAPVELAGGFGSICVRTEERMLLCRHSLREPEERTPDPSPVVLEHASFDPTRDFFGRPTAGQAAP